MSKLMLVPPLVLFCTRLPQSASIMRKTQQNQLVGLILRRLPRQVQNILAEVGKGTVSSAMEEKQMKLF